MKKQVISITSALFLTLSFVPFTACTSDANAYGNVKNVILVIGDGMGNNHIENTLLYFDLQAPDFIQDKVCEVYTSSADSVVTDSAAAATAMSTGQKVNNSSIAYSVDGEQLTSISKLAKDAGKKVGIVTTDTLDGATPAAFSSHAKTRGESQAIARGQAQSDIDLFLGKASVNYTTTYASLFQNRGYDIVVSETDLHNKKAGKKLMATLPNVQSSYCEGHETEYQLKDMAAFALDFLDNENGYFLMIEGAYIDKFSHDNQLVPALCETRSLFDTVDYLYQTVGEDTAIIVTADHETGNLMRAPKKELLTNHLYGSKGHTFNCVSLFLKNCILAEKDGEEDIFAVQNTKIFEICKALLKV